MTLEESSFTHKTLAVLLMNANWSMKDVQLIRTGHPCKMALETKAFSGIREFLVVLMF